MRFALAAAFALSLTSDATRTEPRAAARPWPAAGPDIGLGVEADRPAPLPRRA